MESHTKKYSQFICSIRWFGNGPSVSDETVAAGTSEPLTGASSKVGGNYMAGISFRCRKLRIRHARQLGGNYMVEIVFATVLNVGHFPRCLVTWRKPPKFGVFPCSVKITRGVVLFQIS